MAAIRHLGEDIVIGGGDMLPIPNAKHASGGGILLPVPILSRVLLRDPPLCDQAKFLPNDTQTSDCFQCSTDKFEV